eukprot:2262511-Lingulodinium_polyedra.AAC.1
MLWLAGVRTEIVFPDAAKLVFVEEERQWRAPECPPPFEPRPVRFARGHHSEDDKASGLALELQR